MVKINHCGMDKLLFGDKLQSQPRIPSLRGGLYIGFVSLQAYCGLLVDALG